MSISRLGGGLSFVLGLYHRFVDKNCFFMAAAISYYGVFSLFPLLLVSVAVVGYVLPTSPVLVQVENLVRMYAPGSEDFLIGNLGDLVRVRSQMGVLGAISLIWVSSGVFSAISRSLNDIWGVTDDGPFWRTRLVGVLMVLFLGLLVVFSLGLSTAYDVLRAYDVEMTAAWGIQPVSETMLWQIVLRGFPGLLTFVVFWLIYEHFPARKHRFSELWPGALVGTVFFETARLVFSNYLRTVPTYRLIHGSLATMIFLLLWIYVAVLILMLGAVINVHLEASRKEGW